MSVLNVAEPAYMADEELRMFRDSVGKFFAHHAPPERSALEVFVNEAEAQAMRKLT